MVGDYRGLSRLRSCQLRRDRNMLTLPRIGTLQQGNIGGFA